MMDQNIEMPAKRFTSKNIQVLPGNLAIRQRLTVYTKGESNQERWQWLVHEVIKSATIDEMCNRPSKIKITLHPDDVIVIEDNGRGLPIYLSSGGIDVVASMNENSSDILRPNLEFILTCVYAGIANKAVYEKTGFLLGLGPVLVSLTHSLDIMTWCNNKIYTMCFAEGKIVELLRCIGKTDKQGTQLTFTPSTELFGKVQIDYRQLTARCDELWSLTMVEIECHDLR